MAALLIALVIIIILFGLGFTTLHVLWWIAAATLVIWLLGFLFRAGEAAGTRRRWFYW